MSGPPFAPSPSSPTGPAGAADAPPPRRRSRHAPTPLSADVVRGAPAEALDRPAGDFLDAVPWEGPAPDPDALDAATFLAWL